MVDSDQDKDFIKIGKYKVIPPNRGGLLGQGAFGRVFKGIDPDTKQFAALKLIPKHKVNKSAYSEKLLQREIEIQKEIRGKNIVNFIDLFEYGENICLVTEFCDDGDLAKKIQDSYIMPTPGVSETLMSRYLKDFLAGYKILRERHIIHRDIKPGNLLIHEGTLKIADFGLAKHMETNNEELQMTLGIGSPIYMAPEVLLKQPYDNRSDIWSLGITLHEALFGDSPWREVKNLSDLHKVVSSLKEIPYKFPGNKDSKFKTLLEGMLKFSADDRLSWDQLFNHSILDSNNNGVNELTNAFVVQRLKDIDEDSKTKNYSKDISVLGKKTGTAGIVILQESKGGLGDTMTTLKGSRIQILEKSSAPFYINAKKSISIVKDEHVTDDELREIVKKEEFKKIYKNNKRIIHHQIKIAQYILYAYHQCEQIFQANSSDENSFFSKKRLMQLEGMFMKIACIILENLELLQERNTLNLELWEKFLQTPEWADEQRVVKGIFKTFKLFFNEYKLKLTPEQKEYTGSIILADDFKETAEFRAYLAEFEKEFVGLSFTMLKGVGKNIKREFLIIVEYVLNVLHWKTVFQPKKDQFVEIEKLLEDIQYESDSELLATILSRVNARIKVLYK